MFLCLEALTAFDIDTYLYKLSLRAFTGHYTVPNDNVNAVNTTDY